VKVSMQHPDNVPVMYNDVVLALPDCEFVIVVIVGSKKYTGEYGVFQCVLIPVVTTECTSRAQLWSAETSDRS
jgi:hypothetical protein